jgi:DNA polymerase I-like protein with 3'-5' exonuclease and polymerase domains
MAKIKAAVSEAYEGSPPMTEEARNRTSTKIFVPQVSTAKVTLEESGDFLLEQFAEFGEWSSVLKKDVKMFEKIEREDGTLVDRRDWPMHTRYGIADTTRSTSSKPNVQNFRRKAGIRECVIPRPGHAFVGVDHGGLELCTLAQVIVNIFKTRHMADKINAGMDLHCDIAKEILGWSYEETFERKNEEDVKNKRNCAKVVNFGRPGFMGAPTLVHYAKHSYGVDFAEVAPTSYGQEAEARALNFSKYLIKVWEKTNPEGRQYLEWVKRLPEEAGGRVVWIPGTTIVRRGATVAASANTGFQGLGAILEAHVGWTIAKEIYVGSCVLSKCRLVNFVHDEFILEVPLKLVTEAGARLEVIMAEAPKKYLPDVAIGSEAVAMMRWSKKAKRIVVNGELIPWEEKQ